MAILLDTSILVRLAHPADPLHGAASNAMLQLHRRGESLHITPQNLVEFWNVATRPIANRGLGLTTAATETLVLGFEKSYALLADGPGIITAWRTIVIGLSIMGKQVHDARLAAVCHVYGITHVLTFNLPDFRRFATFGPGLVIVDPRTI